MENKNIEYYKDWLEGVTDGEVTALSQFRMIIFDAVEKLTDTNRISLELGAILYAALFHAQESGKVLGATEERNRISELIDFKIKPCKCSNQ